MPLVDPTANRSGLKKSLDDLALMVRDSDVPIAVFPEGTRTKDGEIGRFKTGALNRILAMRPWTVYVYVVDGFWAAAKYKDVLRELPNVNGKIEHAGTLEWNNPETDPKTFVEEVREMMVERLTVMRDEKTVR
jgi:1-acyl-sn-glycerol-3-phosphate acyltransferase